MVLVVNMVTDLQTFKALEKHFEDIKDVHLDEFFTNDPERVEKFSLQFNRVYFDYSKNRVNDETLELFFKLLNEVKLRDKIDAMFSGQNVNFTESKPALHIALRNLSNNPIVVNGKDVMPDVAQILTKMADFSSKIRDNELKGYTDKPIRNIINIGIGGSYLGPKMACEALKSFSNNDLTIRFISNIDPADFIENTKDLNPEETLFIIASKSFTTRETMKNANTAKEWVLARLHNQESINKHFVAVSTNTAKVKEFGINPERMFEFWDWVGGRYSLTSAIGLIIMVAIGKENFFDLLSGFNEMDNHFKNTEFNNNIPVIMAILSVWYGNFFNAQSHCVLPYSDYLKYLVEYLQQLEMESNGKSINYDGIRVTYQTGQIIWGGVGTNSQHSFHQLLHQGTELVPCDFIGFKEPVENKSSQHEILLANLIAQTEALAFGKQDTGNLHKNFPGNKPSNTIILPKLTPYTLGALISLYEHKTFTQSVIWGINPFDQFGVELGKNLAKNIEGELNNKNSESEHDSSTNNLINKLKD